MIWSKHHPVLSDQPCKLSYLLPRSRSELSHDNSVRYLPHPDADHSDYRDTPWQLYPTCWQRSVHGLWLSSSLSDHSKSVRCRESDGGNGTGLSVSLLNCISAEILVDRYLNLSSNHWILLFASLGLVLMIRSRVILMLMICKTILFLPNSKLTGLYLELELLRISLHFGISLALWQWRLSLCMWGEID